jgi:hypothetical protein
MSNKHNAGLYLNKLIKKKLINKMYEYKFIIEMMYILFKCLNKLNNF